MKRPNLPTSFWSWVLLCSCPLPIVFFLMHYTVTLNHLKDLEERLDTFRGRKEHSEQLQKKQHLLSEADPFYIDKHLESLTFLEADIKKVQMLCAEGCEDELIQKRLHYLKEGANRLLFAEDKIHTKEKMREVFEKQQHFIEVNEEDLKKLLCLIEGTTIWPYGPKENRPQLIIQDFHLSKKTYTPQDRVFVINMNIIKREGNENK